CPARRHHGVRPGRGPLPVPRGRVRPPPPQTVRLARTGAAAGGSAGSGRLARDRQRSRAWRRPGPPPRVGPFPGVSAPPWGFARLSNPPGAVPVRRSGSILPRSRAAGQRATLFPKGVVRQGLAQAPLEFAEQGSGLDGLAEEALAAVVFRPFSRQ